MKPERTTSARRRILLTGLAALLGQFHPLLGGDDTPSGALEGDFLSPPESVRPSGYWWWLNGNVDREAITRDMEEFRAKGMGAVLLVSSGQWGGRMPVRGPAFLSDEWLDLYRHALREAHRVGIKVDVNLAPGWNMGGP